MVMRWLSSLPVMLALAVSAAPAWAQLAGQTVAIVAAGPLSGGAAVLGTEQITPMPRRGRPSPSASATTRGCSESSAT